MTSDSPQELIRAHLKANSKGLTIEEVSRQLTLNRATVAKYLNALVLSGQADCRELGRAKLFSFNKRIPLTYIINLLSDLILIIDKDLFIIDANTSLEAWFGISHEDLVKKCFDQTSLNSCLTDAFHSIFSRTLEGTESLHEIPLEKGGVVRYFRTRFVPLVLEDGNPGVVIIFEDITEIKQNQFELEGRVRERTDALTAANDKLIKKIGEHERTLAALKESEKKYYHIIETAREGILMGNNDFTIVFANQKFADILGYTSPREVIGKNIMEFFFPEDRPYLAEHVENKAKGLKQDYECRVCRKDGGERWVLVFSSPVTGNNGTFECFVSMMTDITRQKLLEKELESNGRYYELLLQTSTDGVHVLDKYGNLREWNPAFLLLLGYTAAEAASLNVRDWDAHANSGYASRLIRADKPGEIIRFETRYLTKSGALIDVDLCVTRTFVDGEEMLYVSARDISRRKNAERALMESERWFRDAAETAGGLIWEVDENGLFCYCSPAIEKILGYTPDEVIGKMYYYDIFNPCEREQLKAAAEQVFNNHAPHSSFVNRNICKNGSTVLLESSAVPVFDTMGVFRGYRGIDIVVHETNGTPAADANAKKGQTVIATRHAGKK